MEAKFKRGDKVRLKSGSPLMTADEYEIGHDIMGAIQGMQNLHGKLNIYGVNGLKKNKPMRRKFHQDMLDLVTE